MTQILGTVADSGGFGVTGTFTATLAANLVDQSTSPDTIHVPRSYSEEFELGEIDINLPESETGSIPYRITYVGDDGITYIDTNAIVPNVGTIDLSSLLATGFAGVLVDDSAWRVARVISDNSAFLQILRPDLLLTQTIEILNAGTSADVAFANPWTGDISFTSMTVRARATPLANYTASLRVNTASSAFVDEIAPATATAQAFSNGNTVRRQTFAYTSDDVTGIMARVTSSSPGLFDVTIQVSEI